MCTLGEIHVCSRISLLEVPIFQVYYNSGPTFVLLIQLYCYIVNQTNQGCEKLIMAWSRYEQT